MKILLILSFFLLSSVVKSQSNTPQFSSKTIDSLSLKIKGDLKDISNKKDSTKSKTSYDTIYDFVDKEPVFPGGINAFSEWVNKNFDFAKFIDTLTTVTEIKFGSDGRISEVITKSDSNETIGNEISTNNKKWSINSEIIIEKDGRVSDVIILSTSNNKIAKEVKNLLLKSPIWIPAFNNGNPVRCRYFIPLDFNF
jgi:hypothetical protein